MRKFALTAMLLGMPLPSRAQTTQNSRGALNTLHVGQRIEIVETNLKKHNGMFSMVTDEVLQLREGSGDVVIKREDVMRVTLLDKSKRLRNAVVLGAVGAGASAGIGAAASRCSNSNTSFNFCGSWREAPASAPQYPLIPQFIEQSQRNRTHRIDALVDHSARESMSSEMHAERGNDA